MKNSVLSFLMPLMLSIMVVSCDSENSDVIYSFNNFPDRVTLKGKNTQLQDSIHIQPLDAVKNDSLIFIIPRGSAHPIHIFNRDNFGYIKAAGKIGKGPGEINRRGAVFFNRKNNEVWLKDGAKKKLAQFPIDSILTNSHYLYKKSIDIPDGVWVAGKGHFINDSTLLQYFAHKDGLFFTHRNGKILDTIGSLPKREKKYGKEKYYLHNYYAKADYVPLKDIAIAAYMHYDIFELYDINTGKKIKHVMGPDKIEPVLTANGIVNTNKSLGAYYEIKTDNKYIYLGYLGEKMLKKSDESEYGKKAAYPSQIHVHDFNGKPVMKIELDREFKTFLIDRKKEQIITLGAERDPEEGLFRIYDYPEEL